MSAIKLEQFGGQLPAWDNHLLPTGQAAYSKNGYLFSGRLEGWRKPKLLRTISASTRMAFRIPTVTETQAGAFLLFHSTPLDGDTVTIGDLVYTFRTTLVEVPDSNPKRFGQPLEVKIGGGVSDSSIFLWGAITIAVPENGGILYGSDTYQNGQVKIYPPGTEPVTGLTGATWDGGAYTVFVGALDFGTAYNLVKVAESTGGVRMQWVTDLTSLATTTTYQGGSNPVFENDITGAATWMEFDDPDTNIVKSPVVDDQWNRYYFASPSRPPEYNTYDRIVAGSDPWLLGVPPPGCAVTLSVTGGGNNMVLGNYTQAGGKVDGQPNFAYLVKVTPPGDTQIVDIQFRLSQTFAPDDGYPKAYFAGLIYEDNSGAPGELLNTGKIKQGVTSDEPNQSDFLNPTSLIGNLDYWIGFMTDTAMPLESGPVGGASNISMFEVIFANGPPGTAPNGAANTTLTSDEINPADGSTLKIGFNTYTFDVVLVNTPGHVHIGATADDTLINLAHCVNASGGTPGVDYGAASAQNSLVSAGTPANHKIVFTGRSTAVAGNNIDSTSTSPHLTFTGVTFQSGSGLSTDQPGINMWGDFLTSDIIEARSYVYTWVTAYGEEGPPSPPTLLDGWSNGTWTIGLWQPPADDLGGLRNLKKARIYRTVPGNAGTTVFFFVAEVEIGTTTYVDTIPDNEVALNEEMPSLNWFPPPANMQGLTVMQNGMIAGFVDNEVWFCEPFRAHAWPPGFVLTTDFPIVGLGVTAGNLVVCTNAMPYVISGGAPGQLTMVKCSTANPCSSRASIIGGDAAVSYMSPNGLIQVTGVGVATNTTDLWFTREQWRQLTPQTYARAIHLASCYYALGSVSPTTVSPVDTSQAQRGFTIELDQDNTSFTIWPQPGGHRLGFNLLDSPVGLDVLNLITDPWTGIGMVVTAGKLWYFDFGDAAPEMIPYTWKSKLYQQNTKRNYSAMKVFFTVPTNTPAQNATRITAVATNAAWSSLPTDSYGFLKTYADVDGTGNLTIVDAREIRKSGELLRIVDGFKADTWTWQVEGRVLISNIQIATSVKELADV